MRKTAVLLVALLFMTGCLTISQEDISLKTIKKVEPKVSDIDVEQRKLL
jgi:hypothetical protein